MIALLSGVALLLTACVQDSIVFEKFGTVTVDIDVPEPLSVAGIRVHLSGTGDIRFDHKDCYGALFHVAYGPNGLMD